MYESSKRSTLKNVLLCLLIFTTLMLTSRIHDVVPVTPMEGQRTVIYEGQCSQDTMDTLINVPLNISVHAYVNTEDLEATGCFKINPERPGIWRLLDEANFAGMVCSPTEKRFYSTEEYNTRIALASIPGSGNTWTRHLLEEITGIYTGTVGLGGRAEVDKVLLGNRMDHNVVVIKTHGGINTDRFDRAIIIVRDPFDFTLANMNRKEANKTAFAPNITVEGLNEILLRQLNKNGITKKIYSYEGDMFILFYEKLKTDLMNSLTKLAAFCNAQVTLKRLYCTLHNSEGSFHRGERPEWMARKRFIDDQLERNISNWFKDVRLAIKKCGDKCATN